MDHRGTEGSQLDRTLRLARIIRENEDAEDLFCYKHGVKSMFEVRRKASACPTIAQHSVCCSQRFSESQLCCTSINCMAVPMAEPFCRSEERRVGKECR